MTAIGRRQELRNRASSVAPRLLLWVLPVVLLAGCYEPPRFQLNREGNPILRHVGEEYQENQQLVDDQERMLVDGLVALFGEPDEPYAWPGSGLDQEKLNWAGGRTGLADADHGLYREHCAHCHGVTGGGDGPTARFLNPYPRDYRKGLFKFTSTEGSTTPPTQEDLMRTLRQGIPGTAMPSFMLLPEQELEALVEYVKYLSIRGQVEQLLWNTIYDEGEGFEISQEVLKDNLTIFVGQWDRAADRVLVPEKREMPQGEELLASIEAGGKLFHDAKRAKCSGCHGPTGLGDGQVQIDSWNEPKQKLPEDLFTLPLQNLNPRNLRLGIFRGGRRPVDLYRRVAIGIKGAKMPAAGNTLKPEEIWQLVDYVRSLPYLPQSQNQNLHSIHLQNP